jgi:hypothetical protein
MIFGMDLVFARNGIRPALYHAIVDCKKVVEVVVPKKILQGC